MICEVISSSEPDKPPAKFDQTSTSTVEDLREIFHNLCSGKKLRQEFAADETVKDDVAVQPQEMEYKNLRRADFKKLKAMKLVGALLATPVSAMKAMESSNFNKQTIERNLFLCGLSLIAMGYLPNELKLVRRWKVYDREKIVVENPGMGIYFIINLKPNLEYCAIPIHAEFVPTAQYLKENPEIWRKIQYSFDFNKMFEKYKSTVQNVALLECEAFKQYMSEGGKLENICNYVNWLIEANSLEYERIVESTIENYPKQTTSDLKKYHPGLYLLKWDVIMHSRKRVDEPNSIFDVPSPNPIESMTINMFGRKTKEEAEKSG